MENQYFLPRILTPFNYVYWKVDIQVSLQKLGLYRMTMAREIESHHHAKKNKFLNQLDESFVFLCAHISRDLLFHLEGLNTPKEAWEKLELLYIKKYELQGHILENELVYLHPSNFETIEQFFTKFKSLALQCRQCGIERKDEKNVLSILIKLGSGYSVFVSIFHSKWESFLDWKVPSLDSFSESLIKQQDIRGNFNSKWAF